MAPIETYNVSKKFSDIIELDLNNATILDCQTKTCSVFIKNNHQKEIAVFGDYEILVLYSKSSEDRKSNLEAITIRKNICEIVPFDEIIKDKALAALSLQPTCRLSYITKSHYRSLWEIEVLGWEIEVLGEINITGTINEAIDTTGNTNTKEEPAINSCQQNTEKKQIDSHVWQFEEMENITIEQLMDMDLESLKKIAK